MAESNFIFIQQLLNFKLKKIKVELDKKTVNPVCVRNRIALRESVHKIVIL